MQASTLSTEDTTNVKTGVLALVCAIALSGAAHAQGYDFNARMAEIDRQLAHNQAIIDDMEATRNATTRLHVGMTEDQVRATVGAPTSAYETTCGQITAKPWHCLMWQRYSAAMIFGQHNGVWLLAGWQS
jgi:hypothetical protein